MRALVVGLGSIGRRHARNWASLGVGELLVCREFGAAQPEPLGVEARYFDSLDRALGEGPDVVLVTNPTSMHVSTAQRAIDAGAHVLVEKPLGHLLDSVPHLLNSANKHHRSVAVGYNLHFHPGLARLRAMLRRGDIGRPLSARVEMGEFLPGWHPWEDYRQAYSARRDLGGGPVLTFSHELDTLVWLLGVPRRLTALTARASELEISTEDVAEIAIEFESGALGSIHVDFIRRPPRRSVEVIGDAGVLRWEYDANRVLQYAPATRSWRIEEGDPTFERNQMYVAELRHFVSYIEHGGTFEPLSNAEQGAAVLLLALGALRSSAEGCAIEFTHAGAPATQWLRSLG